MNELYILDLDQTIFDTERFYRDLITHLEQHHAIDRRILAISEQRYRFGEDNRYDFFSHIKSHYDLDLHPALQSFLDVIEPDAYVYDDVAAFVDRVSDKADLRILTTGFDNFAKFKIASTPQLARIAGRVLDHNKGLYLHSTMYRSPAGLHVDSLSQKVYQKVNLIDDKPVTFSYIRQEADMGLYRIARHGARYSHLPSPNHVLTISGLSEVA